MSCPSCCPVCGTHYPVIVLMQDCERRHHEAIRSLADDVTPDLPPDRIVRTR